MLYSEYLIAGGTVSPEVDQAIKLGVSIDGTFDEIVICTQPLSSNSDVIASINWRELA